MSKWHKGHPPSVGWWPASDDQEKGFLRWWDGKRWSIGVFASLNAFEAAKWAKVKQSKCWAEVEWQDRPKSWPERSKT
jgi:hypothetical protein